MKLAYFVHDLADPAVARRVATLTRLGVEVALFGFRRSEKPHPSVSGIPAVDLGQTYNGKLARRAFSVWSQRALVARWAQSAKGAGLFLARNMEMLVLADAARALLAPDAPLVYELLDIHSSMVGDRLPSKMLREIEERFLNKCKGVLISSQAFDENYLKRRQPARPEPTLIENKVIGDSSPVRMPRAFGPPWRIGFFGVIRCRRSLECLADLVRCNPNLIEVDIRGTLAEDALGDSVKLLNSTPGLRYFGPYNYFTDLPKIYGAVHFIWAIDFYEAGANSSWLLPNRLYEGGLHGAVRVALKSVETGRWLDKNGVGITLDAPVEVASQALFETMTPERYSSAFEALMSLGESPFRWGPSDDLALMSGLTGLAGLPIQTEHPEALELIC